MKILGIETSCDETAIAVIEAPQFKIIGSALHSQIDLHKEYGGVYPNLAKREHIKNLPIVLSEALQKAGIEEENLAQEINMIAVTVGPGLEPALWTGITFAKELGEKHNIPLVPTNHMEGHIASILLEKEELQFPAVALLISGGHTELVHMKSWTEKEIIGATKDDAVGEAFDKVARMLGLSYPGGPQISKLAREAREENLKLETNFPRPMIHSKDYNFSFSGLKTAVLYYIRNLVEANIRSEAIAKRGQESEDKISDEHRRRIAREFEDSVVEVLTSKSKRAIEEYHPRTFVIGGGVIANRTIRAAFEKLLSKFPDTTLRIPDPTLATDNAVMIAIAGYFTHLSDTTLPLKAQGNLKIG